jgi:hypothetical protein
LTANISYTIFLRVIKSQACRDDFEDESYDFTYILLVKLKYIVKIILTLYIKRAIPALPRQTSG